MDTSECEKVSPGRPDSETGQRCPEAQNTPPDGATVPSDEENRDHECEVAAERSDGADSLPTPNEPAKESTEEDMFAGEVNAESSTDPSGNCAQTPQSEPLDEPSDEPPPECSGKPASDVRCDAGSELSSEHSSEPAVEPLSEPSSEPAVEHSSEPSSIPALEPLGEPLSIAAVELSGEPSVNSTTVTVNMSPRDAPRVSETDVGTSEAEGLDPEAEIRVQSSPDKYTSPNHSAGQQELGKPDSMDSEKESEDNVDKVALEQATDSVPKHPSSLSVSPPGDSSPSSGENSRPSSSNISPMVSPSKTSTGLMEANQATDARNAQTLQDIQGDIQCVISQSLQMFSSDGPMSAQENVSQAAVNSTSTDSRSNTKLISGTQGRVQEHSETTSRAEQTSPQNQISPADVVVNGEESNNINACRSPNESRDIDESDQLLSELDAELTEAQEMTEQRESTGETLCIETPNGIHQKIRLTDLSEYKLMKTKNELLSKQQNELKAEPTQLKVTNESQVFQLAVLQSERDDFQRKLQQQKEGSETENIYQAQIKELEATIAAQEKELQVTKEKLGAHDSAAKRAVATLQNELKSQVDRVKKMYEECRKEKEGMTMKYAQAEQKNIELQQRQGRIELQMKDMVRERETVIARFKAMKAEKLKIQEIFEARSAEFGALRKEVEKHKEALQSADMKVKWHQNKLKVEGDQHKETKLKVEELQRKLNQAKEETEQIRRDCQAMVKTYQESDDIKSNSLGKELKQKEEKLQQQIQEKTDHLEVHETVKKELDTLKRKHKDTIEELKTMKDRVTCLEAERITQEHTLDRFKETLQTQKRDNKDLQDKVVRLDTVEQEYDKVVENTRILENRIEELQHTNKELNIEMEGCAKRESEHLLFSQKVSDKNAQLQSENSSLNTRLIGVTAEQERLQTLCDKLEKKVASLEKELAEEKKLHQEEVTELAGALHTKSKAVEELSRQVEEEKDEIRTIKRKHTANIKDLTRQLHQTRKKLDALDQNKTPVERDSLSVGSRTSSNGSLDTLGTSGNPAPLPRVSSQETTPQEEAPPIVEVIEVDKQMLVEKIVRLQKAHARKNEKMEFMEDHINQLVTDIQRKAKIIQNYVMRDESGSLAPESMDRHKAQLAKKGGIMASLYNSHSEDGAMNLDLSLEINHKLQSVLEDTLLKNITLKDNIETLGEEIARISQENRKLQLHLQSQKAKGTS